MNQEFLDCIDGLIRVHLDDVLNFSEDKGIIIYIYRQYYQCFNKICRKRLRRIASSSNTKLTFFGLLIGKIGIKVGQI